jgi:transcription antitermination factor NusG
LLTDGAHPVPVPEGIMTKLLNHADAQGVTSAVALQLLWKGCKVRVCDGIFAGQLAEVDSIPPGALRVNLLLNLLGRLTNIQVAAHTIEPA